MKLAVCNVTRDGRLEAIRLKAPDYDGDGNTTEGMAEELETLQQVLYGANQYVTKDPGGFAHNPKYIAQLLYDSLENFGALKEGMLRP